MANGRSGGYARIENAVFDEYAKDIGCIGIAIYGLLARYADAEGECYPSLTTICDVLGISRPTAIKYLALLQGALLIESEYRWEGASHGSNLYRLKRPNGNNEGASVVKEIDHLVNDVYHPSKADLPPLVNVVYSEQDPCEQDPRTQYHVNDSAQARALAAELYKHPRGCNAVYKFLGSELSGEQHADWVTNLQAHLERGRTITVETLEAAGEKATVEHKQHGQGRRRTMGWFYTALKDLLNPETAGTGRASNGRYQADGHSARGSGGHREADSRSRGRPTDEQLREWAGEAPPAPAE